MAKTTYLLILLGNVVGFCLTLFGLFAPMTAVNQTRMYADLAARRIITPEALGEHLERQTYLTTSHVVAVVGGFATMELMRWLLERWKQRYTLRDLD
jgi:hypothetical protein